MDNLKRCETCSNSVKMFSSTHRSCPVINDIVSNQNGINCRFYTHNINKGDE